MVPGQRIPAHQIGLQVLETTIATEVVLGTDLSDRDFYVVKTTDSVFSDHSFQHRLEQSSMSLKSSNLFGALHS